MASFSLSATVCNTLILFHLFFTVVVYARNVTIDDQFGDQETGFQVIYQPDGMWQQGSNCTTCLLAPNVTAAYDYTWHDSTWIGQAAEPFSFTLLFNGERIELDPAFWLYLTLF